jgi:hypothetical protein
LRLVVWPFAFTPVPELPIARWASLYVASLDMQLALDHGAVVAGTFVRAPIGALASVGNTRHLDTVRSDRPSVLRIADTLGPIRKNRGAAEDDPIG